MLDLWQRMFDPMALAIVGGGSLGVAAVRSTGGDLKRALRALRPLFRSSPDRDAAAADVAVRQIERLADVKGIATRVASGQVMNALARRLPALTGGSAA